MTNDEQTTPIGADATFMQIAGMIFAAHAEFPEDERLAVLEDETVKLLMDSPDVIKGLLIDRAKAAASAASAAQHRPANPFLEKMVKARAQPVQDSQQLQDLAQQLLDRLNNGTDNRTDAPADSPAAPTTRPATAE